jgi:hypothetical protein
MPLPILQRNKARFRRFLEKRFSLRLHMFLILTGVFCIGLLTSKLLLALQVRSMLLRYPLAVVCSYIAFFGLVKLWLLYLSSSTGSRTSFLESGSDTGSSGLPDFSLNFSGPGSGGSSFSGGGGAFSGGGASGSFDLAPEISTSNAGGGLAGDIADSAGDAVSGIFDGDDAWVLIVLAILLAIAFGAGIYLIWQAPLILSDAAFQAILSTSLLKSMKKMSDPDWTKGVLRTTVFPFGMVLVISIGAAGVIHHAYPQATKISEVVRYLFQ